ncbi:MAG: hypothetical protein ACE5HI_17975 [bacterium]
MKFFKPNIKKMLKNKDINGLIRALSYENYKNINIPLDAKDALIDIGSPAVEPLIEAAKNTSELDLIRNTYIEILGLIGDIRAADFLLEVALKNIESPSMLTKLTKSNEAAKWFISIYSKFGRGLEATAIIMEAYKNKENSRAS